MDVKAARSRSTVDRPNSRVPIDVLILEFQCHQIGRSVPTARTGRQKAGLFEQVSGSEESETDVESRGLVDGGQSDRNRGV